MGKKKKNWAERWAACEEVGKCSTCPLFKHEMQTFIDIITVLNQ
jgi:hypothetical protein